MYNKIKFSVSKIPCKIYLVNQNILNLHSKAKATVLTTLERTEKGITNE